MAKRKINATEFVNDYKAGMKRADLRSKYELSAKQLKKLMENLAEQGRITLPDDDEGGPEIQPTVELAYLCPNCGAVKLVDSDKCFQCGHVSQPRSAKDIPHASLPSEAAPSQPDSLFVDPKPAGSDSTFDLGKSKAQRVRPPLEVRDTVFIGAVPEGQSETVLQSVDSRHEKGSAGTIGLKERLRALATPARLGALGAVVAVFAGFSTAVYLNVLPVEDIPLLGQQLRPRRPIPSPLSQAKSQQREPSPPPPQRPASAGGDRAPSPGVNQSTPLDKVDPSSPPKASAAAPPSARRPNPPNTPAGATENPTASAIPAPITAEKEAPRTSESDKSAGLDRKQRPKPATPVKQPVASGTEGAEPSAPRIAESDASRRLPATTLRTDEGKADGGGKPAQRSTETPVSADKSSPRDEFDGAAAPPVVSHEKSGEPDQARRSQASTLEAKKPVPPVTPERKAPSLSRSSRDQPTPSASTDLDRNRNPGPIDPALSLLRAVKAGDATLTKRLLASGVSPNASDEDGFTALMTAAASGRDELALLLLKAGADPKAKNKKGETVLDVANRADPPASSLIAALRAQDKAAAGQALIRAIRNNSKTDLTSLIENGADLNAKDEEGATPLMIAAGLGRLEMVKLLLSKGADVNARDKSGVTALGWAYAPTSEADVPLTISREMVQILKQFGARSGAIVGLE